MILRKIFKSIKNTFDSGEIEKNDSNNNNNNKQPNGENMVNVVHIMMLDVNNMEKICNTLAINTYSRKVKHIP